MTELVRLDVIAVDHEIAAHMAIGNGRIETLENSGCCTLGGFLEFVEDEIWSRGYGMASGWEWDEFRFRLTASIKLRES